MQKISEERMHVDIRECVPRLGQLVSGLGLPLHGGGAGRTGARRADDGAFFDALLCVRVDSTETNSTTQVTLSWDGTLSQTALDNGFLNAGVRGPGYAVFGKVTEGMGVVDAIARKQTTRKQGMADVPVEPVIIETVTVVDPEG